MLGVLKRVFAGPEAISDTIGMIRDAGDALVLTAEEKIQYNQQAMESLKTIFDKTEGGALARRMIAMIVTGVWALYVVGMFFVGVAGIWVQAATELLPVILDIAFKVILPSFAGVMTYYFAHRLLGTRVKT